MKYKVIVSTNEEKGFEIQQLNCQKCSQMLQLMIQKKPYFRTSGFVLCTKCKISYDIGKAGNDFEYITELENSKK